MCQMTHCNRTMCELQRLIEILNRRTFQRANSYSIAHTGLASYLLHFDDCRGNDNNNADKNHLDGLGAVYQRFTIATWSIKLSIERIARNYDSLGCFAGAGTVVITWWLAGRVCTNCSY